MSVFKRYSVCLVMTLLTTGLMFASDVMAAGISGRVTDEHGHPLPNVCVNALDSDCEWIAGGVTDENGGYHIDLDPGSYIVSTDVSCGDASVKTFLVDATWADDGSVYECMQGDAVTVSHEAPADGINLVLKYGGRVTGRLIDSSAVPLEGICVNALDPDTFSWLGGDVTDLNGTYDISVDEGSYIISTDVFCGGGRDGGFLIDRCWTPEGGTPDCDNAQPVSVTEHEYTTLSSMVLLYGGVVSGTIFHNDGFTPVTGIQELGVTIFRGTCESAQWAGWAPINPEDGTYRSPGLPPGTYYLQTYSSIGIVADEWWAHPQSTEVCEEAQPVTVAEMETAAGKDFQLYVTADSDSDGLEDGIEYAGCTDPHDADSDDDGILDGVEDENQNGMIDEGETNPCSLDSDQDGLQDGTELGYVAEDVSTDTDMAVFVPDHDPSTTTSPVVADTDSDGLTDGEEDLNHNGKRDEGTCETDASVDDTGIFDGFTQKEIDGTKWKDPEKIRGIKDGRLILGIKGAPEPNGFRSELPFTNPDEIYSIEAEMIYLGSQTQSPGNVIPGVVVGGFFFASGEEDVYAHIGIGDGGEGIKAAVTVMDGENVITKQYFSMEVRKLHPYVLSITYNQVDNQFLFGLKDVISGHEEYLASDAPPYNGPPARSYKALRAAIYGNPEYGVGSVYAAFDNVRINKQEEYYDQFESYLLDPVKWSKQERVRYVKENRLVLSRHVHNGTRYTKERMWEEKSVGSTYFGADIEMTSAMATGNAQILSYLSGIFYNDTYHTDYNGAQGNVGAGIALIYDEVKGYRIGYKIYRCNDADCSDVTQQKYDFMTPLEPERTYHLSVDFTGDGLAFRCNNEVHVVPISSTDAYPPSYRGLHVGVKADAPDGNEAYVRATFDNIRISKPELCPYKWDLDLDRDVDGLDIVTAVRDPYGINPVTVDELAKAFGSVAE